VFAYCVFFVYYVVCVFTTTISLVKLIKMYILFILPVSNVRLVESAVHLSLSVCRLSVTLLPVGRDLKFSAIFMHRLITHGSLY